MKEAIRHRAWELGFDECRFTTAAPPETAGKFLEWVAKGRHGLMAYLERNAHKRVDPQQVLSGARTLIALATSYERSRQVAAGGEESKPPLPRHKALRGVIARYARHKDYHDVLAERLKALTEFVNNSGGPETRSLWYVDTGPLLERDLAQRAGLGFVGKHTNLISRRLGNWIILSEILTSLPLEPDLPERNRCGSCVRCIAACPTGAIEAPFQLDARRCISYLTIELKGPIPVELRRAIGNRIFGCDDCLAACPWNRFAREGQLMKAAALPNLAAPALLELLALSEEEFQQRFSDTPILRSKRRGLLRNVCVALGNVGDESVLPQLAKAASDPEPLIAEHALWAIEEIRKRGAAK